jgi:hypothetical protein
VALLAFVQNVLSFYEKETQVQCGRYIGMERTRVGASLFYTDLVAKLWLGTDFARSAPTAAIPGFLSLPRIETSANFVAEAMRLTNTRLWFGPKGDAASRDGGRIRFGHRFARVYAAGSDPMRPGVEQQPAERSRRALGWWDAHYEEIAAYEPEYHRLNQTMKWSLAASRLVDTKLSSYLTGIAVQSVPSFDAWRARNPQLRFTNALPRTPGIAGKECLPLLSSYSFGRGRVITGGVSTVRRGASIPKLDTGKPPGLRKPSQRELGQGAAGTATKAHPKMTGSLAVEFDGSALARIRDLRGDVPLKNPRVGYSKGTVSLRGAGDLKITSSGAKVELAWTDGDVERGRHVSVTPAKTVEEADALAAKGHVTEAARYYDTLPKAATIEDTSRALIGDIARGRRDAVRKKLAALLGENKQVSSKTREALRSALKTESPGAAHHVDAALQSGKADAAAGVIEVSRGRVVLKRDFDGGAMVGVPPPRTDLGKVPVFFSDDLRVGPEGLFPDMGGQASDWVRKRGIKLTELRGDATALAVPDRLVNKKTGKGYERASTPLPATASPSGHATWILVDKCDADRSTATTTDDCRS